MDYLPTLYVVIAIALVLATGVLARLTKLCNAERDIPVFNTFVFFIGLPVLVFRALGYLASFFFTVTQNSNTPTARP